MTDIPFTVFRVDSAGVTTLIEAVMTGEMSKAMDVLHAAGMMNERSTKVLLAAERDGKDLVKLAHKLVSLASAIR